MFLKKWICVGAAVLLAVYFCAGRVFGQTEEPEVSAQSAVVYCVNTGQVLYSKNGEERLAMASTTKIMTALLTLEEAQRSDREVTVTEEMVAVEGSSMGLKAGDRLTLSALAAGMLTVSGNDAANAAAIAIGGSVEQFAQRMNYRAGQLGMENTHFVTPSGLDDDAHYSTALDMAKLGASAIQNEQFRSLCSQTSVEVTFLEPQKTVTLQNHNRLLQRYPGCIGIKTGFTQKAGRCLVSAAEREGVTLVAVTLNAPDDWNDHEALLDYGFSKVERLTLPDLPERFSLTVVGGEAEQVPVIPVPLTELPLIEAGQTVTAEIQLPRFLYAPVEKGDVVGKAVYWAGGKPVAEAPLVADGTVMAKEREASFWQTALRWFTAVFS